MESAQEKLALKLYLPKSSVFRTQARHATVRELKMKHDQRCRALKMVQASLNNALVTNLPDASGKVLLTGAQVDSALSCVNMVLNDKDTSNTAVSPVDIAQLVLEVLTLILSHLPSSNGPTPVPAPSSSVDAHDTSTDLTLAETIMQIIELLLSKLPQSGNAAASETAAKPEGLSAVDIAGLVLSVLQLLLSKFGTPTPTPALASVSNHADIGSVEPRVTSDSATYTYDTLGRLTSVTLANSDKVVYNYDSVGNRTSVVNTL